MNPKIRPTGKDTSKTNDVADPHPSTEEHYNRQHRPGGASTKERTQADVAATPGGRPRLRETGKGQKQS